MEAIEELELELTLAATCIKIVLGQELALDKHATRREMADHLQAQVFEDQRSYNDK